jgi:phosphotriesterase-related protein
MIRPVPPLEDLAKSILYLFEIGYGDSILFAGDLARRSYWSCYGGKPGLAYLVTGMDNNLRNIGFTQQMLEQIWIENPLRFFS